jgi:pimeloyl-ACP methyl ester carboxylesterase
VTSGALLPLPGPGAAPLSRFPGGYVRLGNRVLYVRHAGPQDGEPAVFVHGLGGGSTNWTDLMGILSGRFRCYAPDLPGFGRSDPPPRGDYSLDSHVESVRAFISSLERAPVHLFGNSLGGAVCTRLAARYPGLVRSLVLVSPALPVYRPPATLDRRMLVAALPGAALLTRRARASASPEQRARGVLDLCYHDPSRMPQERWQETLEEVSARLELGWTDVALARSLRGLLSAYLQPGARSLWRQAGAVHAPVLLIWGRHDKLIPLEVATRARRAFPDARLVVFDDAGHVAMMEKPEETAAEVARFLGL